MASVSKIAIPANITILALPPKCPELNPVENIWQYMRDNWLSNRIFKSYDDIVARLEYARRPTLENHVHWTTPVGSWVLINETWYKRIGGPLLLPQRASFSNSSRERQALEALSN